MLAPCSSSNMLDTKLTVAPGWLCNAWYGYLPTSFSELHHTWSPCGSDAIALYSVNGKMWWWVSPRQVCFSGSELWYFAIRAMRHGAANEIRTLKGAVHLNMQLTHNCICLHSRYAFLGLFCLHVHLALCQRWQLFSLECFSSEVTLTWLVPLYFTWELLWPKKWENWLKFSERYRLFWSACHN